MPSVQFNNETKKFVKDQDFVKSKGAVTWTVNGGVPTSGFETEEINRLGLRIGFFVSFPTSTTATVSWSVA